MSSGFAALAAVVWRSLRWSAGCSSWQLAQAEHGPGGVLGTRLTLRENALRGIMCTWEQRTLSPACASAGRLVQTATTVGTAYPGDDGRPRTALIGVVFGADSQLGHHVALAQAREGARLILTGHEASKAALEKLARQCARLGCPAVDVYVKGASDPAKLHDLVALARSRMGTVDMLTICPLSSPHTTSSALIMQLVKRLGEECVPNMQMKQRGGTRDRRGIIAFLPEGSNSSAPITGVLGGVAMAAGRLGVVGALESKLAPGTALATIRDELAHWVQGHAQEAEGDGLIFVEATVPDDLFTGALFEQDKDRAEQLAEEAAQRVLSPWRHHCTAEWQQAQQADGKAQKKLPSQRLAFAVGDGGDEAAAPGTPQPDWQGSRTRRAQQGDQGKEEEHNPGKEVAVEADKKAGDTVPRQGPYPDDSAGDPEAAELGHDPGPAEPEGTKRCEDEGAAVWLYPRDPPPCTGIDEATGARLSPGALTRLRAPGELGLGKQDKPGAVITQAAPQNLEPEFHKGDYPNEPERHCDLMVHCWAPFNGETPHSLLSKEFITPADLFYVRNHLPVPDAPDPLTYTVSVSGANIRPPADQDGAACQLKLTDLQAGRMGRVIEQMVTLQCAGNRRNEMAAIKLVEGRAPWNHGSIGNAVWTGVAMRDVLQHCGFPVNDIDSTGARHLVMKGRDWHRDTKLHFEVSIPLTKAVDPRGGVMLAWLQNGEPLLRDHGYPLRVIVPGFVGTRSVKWLQSLEVSAEEATSDWQKVDYKMAPQRFKTLDEWKPVAPDLLPAIENMPLQSAILVPEPGTIIPAGTCALWVRGYAWCGAGLPVIRVDVTCDEGLTWELADIVQRHEEPHGEAWAWVKWQVPLMVPQHLQDKGGKWRIACKALNRNYDSQPKHVSDIWNFRGLSCNSWHFCDLCVMAPQQQQRQQKQQQQGRK